MNRSRLDGADPDTITLYRSNGTAWVPLQTTRVNATSNGTAANDTLVYEARTTGFSPLLLAAAEPTASTPVTNATATPAATATATPTAVSTSASRTPTPAATAATTTDSPPSTPGNAPGFGALVAALAILLATTAARGRR
ncbi:hypothetical protein ACFQL0_02900 [Haloplanus litoreus]|uniref:hypothetical protein n=1 Tax=Haloplanus litoreus TaxID=767515 RepID=UPI0036137F93